MLNIFDVINIEMLQSVVSYFNESHHVSLLPTIRLLVSNIDLIACLDAQFADSAISCSSDLQYQQQKCKILTNLMTVRFSLATDLSIAFAHSTFHSARFKRRFF